MTTLKRIVFKDGRTLDCRIFVRTETATVVRSGGKFFIINQHAIDRYDNIEIQSVFRQSDSDDGGDVATAEYIS